MNRDEIIRMAREASGGTTWWPIHVDILERFFAKAYAEGVKAEREDCAKMCERYNDDGGTGEVWGERFADVIRARGIYDR